MSDSWLNKQRVTFSLGRRIRLARWTGHGLHVTHHASCNASSFLCLWLHPNCDHRLLDTLFGHYQSECRYFRARPTLFGRRVVVYHTEMRAFRYRDGYWANWGRVWFHWEEGRLENEGKGEKIISTESQTTVLTVYGCTEDFLRTVAACGSSPQAQCMVGFWVSASDGLVISSESLFGEVGREFVGL